MENPTINQIFVEAKYKNALLFNDFAKLQIITKALEEVFPISNFNQANRQLSLNNVENRSVMNIYQDRLVIDMDRPSETEFSAISKQAIAKVIEVLEIENFLRLGIRSFRGIIVDNIEVAKDYIKNNYLKLNNRALYYLGDKILDYNFVISFSSSIYKVNFRLQPAVIQILEMENTQIKNNVLNNQIQMDIDVFRDEEMNAKAILARFTEDAFNIYHTKIVEFMNQQEKVI